jgi:hypothetical protein
MYKDFSLGPCATVRSCTKIICDFMYFNRCSMASVLHIFFIKSFQLCKSWVRIEIEVVVVAAAAAAAAVVVVVVVVVVSAAVAVVIFLGVFHPIVC